jgi:zinc protease
MAPREHRLWSVFGGRNGAIRATDGGVTTPFVGAESSRRPFEQMELPNGIVVLGQARPDDPVAVVRFRIEAGAVGEPAEKAGLAAFTARMLSRGQAGRTFEQFNELTDGLGASLSVDAGRLSVDLAVRCLAEDLPTVLDLAADVLLRPDFPEDEIEKVRREMLAAIREADDNTGAVADRTLRELLYPEGHPYRRRVAGEADSVAAIAREDLVAHHAHRYGPRVTTVAVVGGVANLTSAMELLHDRFGGWDGPAERLDPASTVEPPAETVREDRAIPGKSQADLVIGTPTLARSHPDYYALETANLILGRLGLMGRLGASVRDRQGLAYYVFSGLETGRDASVWVSRAGVDPKDVDRAIEGILAEVRRLRDEPVDEEELADAKSYLTGVLPLALESNDGVASTLLSIEHFGLGLDYLDRYPAIIGALTREGLLGAAREHLDPDRLAVGVAGPGPTTEQSGSGSTQAS